MRYTDSKTRGLRALAVATLMGCVVSGCGDDGPTALGPASVQELFGPQLHRADGSPVGIQALDGVSVIGIYFASPGCPACGAFSPLLIEAYEDLQEEGRSFEVVMVSLGITESVLFDYMVEFQMPWLAVSPQNSKAQDLVQRYDVRWVPTLVIVDHAGQTLSLNGREELTLDGTAAYDRWLAAGGGG